MSNHNNMCMFDKENAIENKKAKMAKNSALHFHSQPKSTEHKENCFLIMATMHEYDDNKK